MHTSNKQIRTVENESDFQTPQTESKSLACMVFPIVQPNFSMRLSLEFDWNNQIFGENVWANPFGDSAGSVWKVSAFLALTAKRNHIFIDALLPDTLTPPSSVARMRISGARF